MLIARRPESYEEAVAEIKAAGGTAVGVSADASDAASLDAAFERIKTEVYPGHKLAVAVYNAAGGFMRKPFLETSVEELAGSLDGSVFVSPVPRPPSPPLFLFGLLLSLPFTFCVPIFLPPTHKITTITARDFSTSRRRRYPSSSRPSRRRPHTPRRCS